MFPGWQTYYQVVGGAAGALIGLLFIVATLSGRQNESTGIGATMGMRVFSTPNVFHLAEVLAVSALALAPTEEGGLAGLILTLAVLAGLVHALWVLLAFRKVTAPHWSDIWCYGAAPVAVYLALSLAVTAAWLHAPHAACAVALLLLVLLMLAIRNAWDLVTWLAPRRSGDG
jgi:hypothetical protein